MTQAAAYSFLVFNLLCAPCFAAMGAIKREMNNVKWFWFAIGYQTLLAYTSFSLYLSDGNFCSDRYFRSRNSGSGCIDYFIPVSVVPSVQREPDASHDETDCAQRNEGLNGK